MTKLIYVIGEATSNDASW